MKNLLLTLIAAVVTAFSLTAVPADRISYSTDLRYLVEGRDMVVTMRYEHVEYNQLADQFSFVNIPIDWDDVVIELTGADMIENVTVLEGGNAARIMINVYDAADFYLNVLAADPTTGSIAESAMSADRFPTEKVEEFVTNFEGVYQNNTVELNWELANVSDAATVYIERSYDGNSYTRLDDIGSVANASTTNDFRYVDRRTKTEVEGRLVTDIHYRIRVRNSDGVEYRSEAIRLRAAPFEELNIVTLYDTQRADYATLNLIAEREGNLIIQIFDMNGRLRMSETKAAIPGFQSIQVELGGLERGAYVLRVMNESQTRSVKFMR